MKNRRSFLASVAGGGAGIAAAQATAAPVLVAASTPPPTSGAAAFAATMRKRFDAGLTQAQLDAIAHGIDANAKAAATLTAKQRLKNSDEPVLRFRVAGDEA
jgi:hypothetical protein